MSGDFPDSEEELDLGLLDQSDDDNMEVVEEVSASTSKLQKILLQEKMKQSGGFGEPSVPKKRLNSFISVSLNCTYELDALSRKD